MNFTSITTMNFINTFKRLYFQHSKTPLGRWNIHNYKETTLKIDYANEDNCGISSNKNIIQPKHIGGLKIYNPQGDYYHISSRDYINIIYSAKAKEKERKQQQQDDDKYMFMMGFESAHN
jgi:hypothetical protein